MTTFGEHAQGHDPSLARIDKHRLTIDKCYFTIPVVIKTFKSKALRRFFDKDDASGLNPQHVAKIGRILERLDIATEYSEMSLPGWHNHSLGGDRKGFWGVSVSGNYRVIYRLEATDAYDVDYLDYH